MLGGLYIALYNVAISGWNRTELGDGNEQALIQLQCKFQGAEILGTGLLNGKCGSTLGVGG